MGKNTIMLYIYIYFVLYSFQQRDICNYHSIIRVQFYIRHAQLLTYYKWQLWVDEIDLK
jgi:hypothetical protein